MKITLEVPDDFNSLSPMKQMGVMAIAFAATLRAPQDAKPSADSLVFPYFDPAAQHVFKDRAEYDTYWAAVAQRDANLDPSNVPSHAELLPGAFDMRAIANDDPSVRFLAAFYNELVPTSSVGPVAFVQQLSHFMANYGQGMVAPGFPTTASWTPDDVYAIRAGQWDFNYRGPLRAVLAKLRGVSDI